MKHDEATNQPQSPADENAQLEPKEISDDELSQIAGGTKPISVRTQ